MHSNTRRKASPGPRGCWLLLSAFSTNNSIAYQRETLQTFVKLHEIAAINQRSVSKQWRHGGIMVSALISGSSSPG